MELILCEKPKVERDTARFLGIKEQHQEYIVCKDGTGGRWAIGCLFLRSFTPSPGLQRSNYFANQRWGASALGLARGNEHLSREVTLLRLGKVMPIRRLVPRGTP
jgi:hypothetical protein